MRLEEYCQYDGLGLAELVENKETTAQELVDCAQQAIEKVDGDLNCVVEEIPEHLRAKDGTTGPFAGVPFVIKDLVLHMQGVKSEGGSALAAGAIAEADSFLMERYRAAGLIAIARTPTPEWGFNATTESRFNGPTRNPWDTSRSSGGSSGGASAAVASGIVPMAHANDGGGSIRIPASACGLVGLKPSRGRVSAGPDYDELLSGQGAEHAVTRTVRDSAALLDASIGAAPGDPYSIERPKLPYLQEVDSGLAKTVKFAWSINPWKDTWVDAQVAKAVEQVAQSLSNMGFQVENKRPEIEEATFWSALGDIWSAGITHFIASSATAFGRPISAELLESSSLACYQRGMTLGVSDYLSARDVMNATSRNVAAFFEDSDILITPTIAQLPAPLGFLNSDRPAWDAQEWTSFLFDYCPFTPLFNCTGQPAISLPLAQSAEGLPIGVQFVAKHGREDLLFNIAGMLEKEMPWANRKPSVFAGH